MVEFFQPDASCFVAQFSEGVLLKLLKNTLTPSAAFLLLMMVVGRDFGVKLRTHLSKPKLCLTQAMSCTTRTRLALL
jgi:hypothetical protein